MKYTESHEWIEVEDGIGVVGVTDYAQSELGDIVYVELPEMGKDMRKGEEAAVLESTKAAADVYAPVSGKVVAVNEALRDAPETINASPTKEGWLFRVQLSDPQELSELLGEGAYHKLVQ